MITALIIITIYTIFVLGFYSYCIYKTLKEEDSRIDIGSFPENILSK